MSKIVFSDLEISAPILKALEEMGFANPTDIQEKAIPILTQTGKDFVGQAQTGTGKTAAFVIPLLTKIDFNDSSVQALILTPTRELAAQVENEIVKLGKYTDVRSTCVYGGAPYDKQIRALKKDKPQIVVGTPGRVIDLIEKKILKLDKASFCVLDEADEMLNMGFFDDVQMILKLFREERQLIMFSATMPRTIMTLIRNSFREYEMVKIDKKSLSNDDIEQKYFIVKERHFKEALARLIDENPDTYALVFCRTKIETTEVGDELKKRGHSVAVLNGDMGQSERDRTMKAFKEKKVNIMVCTDVAARGIDVNSLTHVFNYGLPQDNESYVHRIGRTGRAGVKGKAYTIVGPKTAFAIKRIERHINKNILFSKLPTVENLKQKAVETEIESGLQILEAIQAKGDTFKTDKSFEFFKNKFKDMSQDELLKLIFTWKFNKTLRHYNDLADIEQDPGQSRSYSSSGGGPRRDSRGGGGGRRYRDSRGSSSSGGRRGAPLRRRSSSGDSASGGSQRRW